jgi:dihydroorotate dehydrogenase
MSPFWRYLPAHVAHSLGGLGVEFTSAFFGDSKPATWNSLTWKGLTFPNRVGLAGGVDKEGEHLLAWQSLGAGFVEIGTVTPLSQRPNSGKIMDRDWERGNLWNKMGFPNEGAQEVVVNLQAIQGEVKIPVFVNLGKNRQTSSDDAKHDYLSVQHSFQGLVDGYVVNVSSPNTQGLRGLQSASYLRPLLEPLVRQAHGQPVLVKLSPDQEDDEFKESLTAAAEAGVSGFVLTNTTLSRPEGCPFPPEGGLSGRDLKALSEARLREAVQILGSVRRDFLLISVGGISDIDDVKSRLDDGADLLEVYSALIFKGPRFFQQLQKNWPA